MSTIISLILTYVSPATPFGSWNLVSWVLGLAWMTPLKTLQLDEWTIGLLGAVKFLFQQGHLRFALEMFVSLHMLIVE